MRNTLCDKEGPVIKEIEVSQELHISSIYNNFGIVQMAWLIWIIKWTRPNSIDTKYKNHPSIKKISDKWIIVNPFSFQPVTPKDLDDVISTLDDKVIWQRYPRMLDDNKIIHKSYVNG